MCGIKQKLTPSLRHKEIKCKQDRPQYNEEVMRVMAVLNEEQAKYWLRANHSNKYSQTLQKLLWLCSTSWLCNMFAVCTLSNMCHVCLTSVGCYVLMSLHIIPEQIPEYIHILVLHSHIFLHPVKDVIQIDKVIWYMYKWRTCHVIGCQQQSLHQLHKSPCLISACLVEYAVKHRSYS
jgi:hypothetical protein